MNTHRQNISHKARNAVVVATSLLLLASCGSGSTKSASTSPLSAAAAPATPVDAGTSSVTDAVVVAAAAPTTPVDAGTSSVTDAVASGAAASNVADPCALLTQAEVDAAAGQPLGTGEQTSTLDDCQWSNSDFSADVGVTVSDWTGIKNAATANGTKSPPPAAPGIGDEAYYYQGWLYVRKGDAGFLLNVGWPGIQNDPDYGLGQATVLAQAVLGRL